MNIIGVTINLICLGFLLYLLIIYFSKTSSKKIYSKIYKIILLCNVLLIISELIFLLSTYYMPNNIMLYDFFKRCSLFFVLTYLIILSYNVFFIAAENEGIIKKVANILDKYVVKVFIFIIFLLGILQFSLPIKFFYNKFGYIYYAYGPSVTTLSTIITIFMLFIIFLSIMLSWKNIDKKKITPFIIVIIINILSFIISFYDLSICLSSFTITLSSFILYSTFENPMYKTINDLTLAKNQAENSNKSKAEFIANLSNEIKRPLLDIVQSTQKIQKGVGVEELNKDCNNIIAQSQNLLDMVNGILELNKLSNKTLKLKNSDYDPKNLFNEIYNQMKLRIGDKAIEFKKEISKEIPLKLNGDKDKLKVVLINLLSNAIKYTDNGTITLKVDCENNDNNCKLIIIVKDTGHGIKESQLPFLFTQFYRLEEDINTHIEGTGIGLALSKSIVDLMGGEITVDSIYKEGSTFKVIIEQKIIILHNKITDEEVNTNTVNSKDNIVNEINKTVNNSTPPKAEKSAIEKRKITSENNTILIVDDNALNLRVASKMIEQFNFPIETAQSGFECIDKIKQNNKYCLIFMDIMMPKMNGVETMKKLKEMEGFNLPIIALTADAMEGSREKYLGDGFDEYLSKPINKELLKELIEKFIK